MKNRQIPNLSAILFIIAFLALLTSCKANRDNLAEKLTSQLRQEDFAELYEQSSDFLHLNVSKKQFIQRMNIAVTRLKAIDENLSFQRDRESEKLLDELNEDVLISSVQTLGEGDNSVRVMFSWDNKGRFNDLSIHWYSETLKKSEMINILYSE